MKNNCICKYNTNNNYFTYLLNNRRKQAVLKIGLAKLNYL